MDDFFNNLTTDFLVEASGPPIDMVGGSGSSSEKKILKQERNTRLSADNLGLTAYDEYYRLLSPTLRKEPHAKLKEKREIEQYLVNQPITYLQELNTLNQKIDKPMAKDCRVAITIPAFQEGDNIKRTLDLFTKQTNRDGSPIDPKLFEIIIIDNHKEGIPPDNTEDEVSKFKDANPDLAISYGHKAWKSFEPACVGNARKYAADLALYRNSQRPEQNGELIIISFDADVDGLNPNYVTNYIKEFDENPQLDAAVGKWTVPEEMKQKPTLHAVQRFRYILDRILNTDMLTTSDKRQKAPPGLIGRNAAFTAAIYAGIGGYNPYAKVAEDLEIGWMIDYARDYDSSRMGYINTTEVVTNPRRYLAAYVQGVPIINMYDDFHENEQLRSLDNNALLGKISNTFEKDRFETEVDTIFQKYFLDFESTNQTKLLKSFKAALYLIGVDYQLEPTQTTEGETPHIKITNCTKLLQNLTNPTFDSGDINNLLRIKKDTQNQEEQSKIIQLTKELKAA